MITDGGLRTTDEGGLSMGEKQKFDMHCHTKEGSLDGKVKIERFIEILMEKGYQGMLVTDHNSYNGYRCFKRTIQGKKFQDFVVLKGIEAHDTIDAGHILVIMPETVKLPILELRGLPVQFLIDIVHRHGGILGPGTSLRRKVFKHYQYKKAQKSACRDGQV